MSTTNIVSPPTVIHWEKIGLSTGLIGLLFLLVLWHYHQSLQGALRAYERLHDLFGAREIYAFEIASALSATQLAEKSFLGATRHTSPK